VSDGPPPVPGGRSPEDREAARREREARRAGKPVPPPPPPPRRAEPEWIDEPAREPAFADTGGYSGPAGGFSAPAAERRRPHWGRLVALGALMLVVFGIAYVALNLFQPFKGEGTGQVRVVVPAGSSLGDIADLLQEKGVISNTSFFELRARLAGRTNELKPGTYAMQRDMTFVAALDALEKGVPPNVVQISVPEGRSRSEIAASLKKSGLRGNYMRASTRSAELNPRRYGARKARNLEGFLFPATYELRKKSTMKQLVREQLKAFEANFAKVDMKYARSKNLTAYDVLIIASMVERESMLAKERPLVASVIYNRLKDGMPLGIDATIRFALNQWNAPLKESELATQSPYNTRLQGSGLPPGPIGNPGLASIQAAARPKRTNFLFYVVKPNTCGEHAFSATDAQFQEDVARYNAEREKRGGKSPDIC
jgi:UPF0755 protein